MTELSLREEVARAIYDADEDAITANIDSNPKLTAGAKREWHKSIGPKVAWEAVHQETRHAYLVRVDAAIDAVMARQGWQPIETAPRDGTPFLAHMTWPENGPIIVKHRPMDQVRGKIGCYEFENNEDIYSRDQFSHWQPLPEPPKGQTND